MMRLPGTVSKPADTMVRQMDLISAWGNLLAQTLQRCAGIELTFIQDGLGVFQDVSGYTGFIFPLGNLVLEFIQEQCQICISSGAKLSRLGILAWPESQQGNVVLPVIACTPEIRNDTLDMADFLKQSILNGSVDADAVVESQACIKCKSLVIWIWVDVNLTAFAIGEELFDAGGTLQVNNGHVGLDRRTIERSCSCLAAPLARVVPWGRTDGEALGGADHRVEGV